MTSVRTRLAHWSDDVLGVPKLLEHLHLLRSHPDVPRQARQKPAGQASRKPERMKQQVAELTTLVRADYGVQIRLSTVNLDRVLLDALAEARHLSRGQRIEIGMVEPASMSGDQVRLKQLFITLLNNALKHTPPRGKVEASLRRTAGEIVVVIEDNGTSIRPEELLWVYERVDGENPPRFRFEVETGVGLAIAAWIAEQHGGELSLASERGKGTKASVRLPDGVEIESLNTDAEAVSRWPSAPSRN